MGIGRPPNSLVSSWGGIGQAGPSFLSLPRAARDGLVCPLVSCTDQPASMKGMLGCLRVQTGGGWGGAWFSTCPWGALRPPAPRPSCPGWEPTRGTEAGGPRTHSSPQSGMVLSSAAAEAGVPHPQVSQEQLQSMLGTDLPRGVGQDSKTTPNCP